MPTYSTTVRSSSDDIVLNLEVRVEDRCVELRFAVEPVADALAAIPEVDYVVVTAGSFDLLVEIVCEDDSHLLEMISKRIRTLPGVRSTESFVYLKLRKQTYAWGTRS